MKRKMDLSGNFVSPTVLQSVAWLSFSIFDGSLKVASCNCNFHLFVFLAKTFQIIDRTAPEGGGPFAW